MTTPDEELKRFLEDQAMAETRRLDVAMCYVRSMVSEMKACTAKWEATERALEEEIRRQSSCVN